LFRVLVGYGYRPKRGLAIALVVAATAGWFYQQAQEAGALTYHAAEGAKHAAAAEPAPAFHPYVYSLDVMLPVVKLGQSEAWKPADSSFDLHLPLHLGKFPIAAGWTQTVVWIETVAGWLAGGILVAIVSGLIKKD
jgi:hypothetical protein